MQQLPPQNEIRRENLQRLVIVIGRLEGSDLGSGIAKVKQAVTALHLPATVRIEYGGTYEEQQKSFRDLLRVLLLALALVFGVLLYTWELMLLGLVIAAFGLGFIIGPAFGAFMSASLGPRVTFGCAALASSP